MQLVSREVLFDVMKHKRPITLSKSMNEAESSAYKTFCKVASSQFQNARSRCNGKHNQAMAMFTDMMLQYMKDNIHDIRYVGQGSSRIVYALADGTALKLAKTPAGLAQNRQESILCMNSEMKYEIFPDFYGADSQTWLSLNCELCSKATREDFKQLFGAQPLAVIRVIRRVNEMRDANRNKGIDDILVDLLDAVQQYDEDDIAAINVLRSLISSTTMSSKALRSLIDFYGTYTEDDLIPDDLEEIENWGLTIRNDQKVLVVIDAGFSDQIWRDFYAE